MWDTNKRVRLRKRLAVYAAISIGCAVITETYALFGHGVRSNAMDWMFLYPLAGGVLVGVLLIPGGENGVARMGVNLTNTGIATLTAGAMLRGILEIAGTASPYTGWFTLTGWGFTTIGATLLLISCFLHKTSPEPSRTYHERGIDYPHPYKRSGARGN